MLIGYDHGACCNARVASVPRSPSCGCMHAPRCAARRPAGRSCACGYVHFLSMQRLRPVCARDSASWLCLPLHALYVCTAPIL
eukprot:353213-Chlamydomonas_euryale.AAC.5